MIKIQCVETKSGFFTKGKNHTFWDPIARVFPPHGWKIHISCWHDNFKDILDIVSEYCFLNGISFKFIHDLETLKRLLSKNANRVEAGKFITVYPVDESQFIQTIRNLYDLLKEYKGPYILSDKRYLDAKVLYYRYGIINSNNNEMVFENEKWIDKRVPYYTIPPFIEDPLYENSRSGEEDGGLMKYEEIEAIHFSNSGGIYRAETNGTSVILKEARPFIGISRENTSIQCREKEFEILRLLDGSGYTPHAYSVFYEWEHFFLEVEYIEGKSLQEYLPEISLSFLTEGDKKEIQIRMDIFKKMCRRMLLGINTIHDYGVIINDISENNIIVTSDGQPFFIDFEDAFYTIEEQKFIIKNDRLTDSRFALLTDKKKDIHKLGYLFMRCISNADYRLKYDSTGKQSEDCFRNFCNFYGVYSGIYECVMLMISGEYKDIHHLLGVLEEEAVVEYERGEQEVLCSLEGNLINLEGHMFVSILIYFDGMYNDRCINHEFDNLQNYVKNRDMQLINEFLVNKHFDFYSPNIQGGRLEIIAIYLYLYSELKDVLYLNIVRIEIERFIKDYIREHYLVLSSEGYHSPYLTHTAGLIRVMIIFLKFQFCTELYNLMLELLNAVNRNFTKEMGYLNGLSGIADTLLEGFYLTKNEEYLHSAFSKINVAAQYIDKSDASFLFGYKGVEYFFSKYRKTGGSLI